MTPARVRAVLNGDEPLACGVTWVPGGTAEDAARAPERVTRLVEQLCADFVFVDARQPAAAGVVEAVSAAGVDAVWSVSGPLAGIAAEWGWGALMRESVRAPDALAERVHQVMPSIVGEVRAGAEAGATVFLMAEDLASTEGWLFDPQFAARVLVPAFAPFAATSAEQGGCALFHSDGDVSPLGSQLVQAGFSGLHVGGVAPGTVADVLRSVRAAGLVPAGGVPVTAVSGGADVEGLVDALLSIAAGGPYLLCDDGGATTRDDLLATARIVREVHSRAAAPAC